MSAFLIRWLVLAVALAVTTQLVSGVHVDSWPALLVASLVIGFINAIVRPILTILTLPLTLVTLGFFYLVVNGISFALAASLSPGFRVDSFGAAILGALVMSIISWLLELATRAA